MRSEKSVEPSGEGSGPPRRARRWVDDALALGSACAWSWDAPSGRVELSGDASGLLGGIPAALDELDALVHEDDRAPRRTALARALARGERWVSSFRLAADPQRWIEERGRGFVDAAGQPARAVALAVDVTSRKQSEETLELRVRSEARDRHAAEVATGTAEEALRLLAQSEAYLESIFASMADALVLFSGDGRITRMNPTARDMLRYSDEACAQPIEVRLASQRFVDEQGREIPRQRLPVVAALRGVVTKGMPIGVHFADGRTLWATAGAAPILAPDHSIVGAVLSLADVTRLRDLQEQREDLSRMIAHDLRTPLGTILAQAKLIGRRAEPSDAFRSRVDAIVKSAQRMAGMLNDLVESALLEAGKLRLELSEVNLADMVKDLRHRLAAPYDAERVRVEATYDVGPVLADAARIERVLVNLLTNALKYSAPTSEVVVRLWARPDAVDVAVQDHGQGIAAEDVPHLFERFFRAGSSFGFEGMGLGLYTSRMLVEAHGGTIAVASVPGQGSVFQVRLPRRPAGA
jgi:PAS domain S-box-containing protein